MQAKEIKEMKIGKEEATLSLFVDEIISYIRNSKKSSTRNILESSATCRHKNLFLKINRFSSDNVNTEKEIMDIHFTSRSTERKYLEIN